MLCTQGSLLGGMRQCWVLPAAASVPGDIATDAATECNADCRTSGP